MDQSRFVPLDYQSLTSFGACPLQLGLLEGLRGGPSGQEVMLVHAVSRIFLHNSINNIQGTPAVSASPPLVQRTQE